MKKLIAFLLAVTMLITMTACFRYSYGREDPDAKTPIELCFFVENLDGGGVEPGCPIDRIEAFMKWGPDRTRDRCNRKSWTVTEPDGTTRAPYGGEIMEPGFIYTLQAMFYPGYDPDRSYLSFIDDSAATKHSGIDYGENGAVLPSFVFDFSQLKPTLYIECGQPAVGGDPADYPVHIHLGSSDEELNLGDNVWYQESLLEPGEAVVAEEFMPGYLYYVGFEYIRPECFDDDEYTAVLPWEGNGTALEKNGTSCSGVLTVVMGGQFDVELLCAGALEAGGDPYGCPVTALVAGGSSLTQFSLGGGSGWFCDGREMASGEVFEAGKSYTYELGIIGTEAWSSLTADDFNVHSAAASVSGTAVMEYEGEGGHSGTLYLRTGLTFTCEEPDHEHNYRHQDSYAGTCTEDGWIYYVCEICGESYYGENPASGHKIIYATRGDMCHQKMCTVCDASIGGIDSCTFGGDGKCIFCGQPQYLPK